MARPLKYGEKTKFAQYKVPESKFDDFDRKAKEILTTYEPNQTVANESQKKFVVGDIYSCGCSITGKTEKGDPIFKKCTLHKSKK